MSKQDEARRSSPYRGLEPFDERDAPFFFGRERETRLITASMFAAPLTLLYGASGVGKSSVLRAGVLPRLRERPELLPIVFPTLTSGPETASTPAVQRGWQTDPLGGIKETAALTLYASAGDDLTLRRGFQEAVLKHEMGSLREFLSVCHEVSGRRLMVILDQFEEYSLYHPDDEAFAEQFPNAIVPGDLSLSFLVSLREDALAKLDRFKGRIATLWDSYRRVDHLDRAAAEDAIRLPVREYDRQQSGSVPMKIEDELVEAVLRDVQTESVQFEETGIGTIGQGSSMDRRIETPYLQLVMTRLWEREQAEGSTTLRWTTLQEEGGAAEIVRTHLDRVMEQFTAEERDVAARVFHRLVTPSGAKIAFSVSDLAEYETIETRRLAPILRRLEEGSRRILRRVAARADSEEPRYEIFHDRLGKAILSWRAKRLKEQEREKTQREEAEQKWLAEQTRASYSERISAAMQRLGPEGQATWARMMFYLVSTDGRRMAQTARDLVGLSQQPSGAVETILGHLREDGILRFAYGSGVSPEQALYEVAHEALVGALLEWHSQYVLGHTRAASRESHGPEEDVSTAANVPSSQPERDFPYRLVHELFRKGRVIPFLGAGVSLSARPQDASSEKTPFLPSNRELKELLARQCNFPASEFEASDIAEVSAFYVQQAGRERLNEFLDETLGRTDYTPSKTHRFLAQVAKSAPLLILTTNFDTLMEKALDEIQQPYDMVAYLPANSWGDATFAITRHGTLEPERFTDSRKLPRFEYDERTVVFRLHGPAITKGRRVGSYVLTEEDQIDWLLRLHRERTSLPPFVLSGLDRSDLLSLGHSARDWTQRALLRSLHEARRFMRRTSWAVALNPAPLSVMTWQRYHVEVYNVELNEWTARMQEAGPRTA